MSEIQIALEYRLRQLEAVLRQARKALDGPNCGCFAGCHLCADWPSTEQALAAIDAVLSCAPVKELSDERILEIRNEIFARAVLKEAGK